MNAADLSSWMPLANHLWQSTAFAGVMWLVTLALKNHRAAVRYWLWFTASIKFLIPFSVLIALGSRFSWRTVAPAPHSSQWSFIVDSAVQPFTPPIALTQAVPTYASFSVTSALIAVWFCGIAVGVVFWLACWRKMQRVRANATPLPPRLPIPVLSSPSHIEPGVYGIFRPVLLLPEGIDSRLTPSQLNTILAHEMAHVRRRDNVTAAIHMIVETVFWFHPLVWWMRSRLIEERERACDEEVLRLGCDARIYAEGIIEVCKLYTVVPVSSASGISGSDLKGRIVRILDRHHGEELGHIRRLLLTTACIVTIAAPVSYGLLHAPASQAQSSPTDWEKAAGGKMSFEVASVKENKSGVSATNRPTSNIPLDAQNLYAPTGGLFSGTNFPLLEYMRFAYKLTPEQSQALNIQVPWANTNRWDIQGRASGNPTKDQMRLMMQSLLADRFKLSLHFEMRQLPVFALALNKSGKFGPQLRPHTDDPPCSTAPPPATSAGGFQATVAGGFPEFCGGFLPLQPTAPGRFRLGARDVPIAMFTMLLGSPLTGIDRPVMDSTGLTGNFDLIIEFLRQPNGPPRPDATPQSDDTGPTFLEALKDQLGLKLESTTGPVNILVIDHIEQPSPN